MWAQDCRLALLLARMSVKMPCHAEVQDTGIGIEILTETPGIFRPCRTCPPLQIAHLKMQVNRTPVLPHTSITLALLWLPPSPANLSQSSVIQFQESLMHYER